jgi:hypothetical protein
VGSKLARLLLLVTVVAAIVVAPSAARPIAPSSALCSAGYVEAHLSWGDKCLRAGEFCKVGNPEYHAYGFDCPATGHLTYYSQSAPAPTATGGTVNVGHTVLLKKRTRSSGCKLGALPDRRCSPGAYYSGLTKVVICSASFHTSSVRHVTTGDRHSVEVEYGLAAKGYGRTLEIDHIVSLELGGSNDVANLYPEEAAFADHAPGFRVKDKLENKLHALVCAGQLGLRTAQRQIAVNWERLYSRVFGVAPTG